jgi:hypothetical protein
MAAIGKTWKLEDAAAALRQGLLLASRSGAKAGRPLGGAPRGGGGEEGYDLYDPDEPRGGGTGGSAGAGGGQDNSFLDSPDTDYQRDERGIWYRRNIDGEWEVAPQWLQQRLEATYTGKGDIRLPSFSQSSGAKAESRVFQDQFGIWRDARGEALPKWMNDMLNGEDGGGGGGGGGGGSPYAGIYADLALRQQAETERQNAWNRMLDYVTQTEAAKALYYKQQAERAAQLATLAPMLAAGFEHYGGFGPTGGYTLLERLQTGRATPRPINIMPVDVPVPQPSSLAQQYLAPLLGEEV